MKKLIEIYKNFKYKKVTALGLLIISMVLFQITNIPVFNYLSLGFFVYLLTYTSVYIYHGLKNHVKDSSKAEGIIVSVIVYAFYLALVALIVVKILIPLF